MNMNLLRNLIRPYLYARYGVHRLTGTGAFRDEAVRSVDAGAQPRWNPLKQAIWKFHVKQRHDSSCSVAAVVSCINAIRHVQNGNADPVGEADILDRVTTGHWKERMSDGGYRGRRGLPLPLLGQVVRDSISAYRLTVRAVDIVQTPRTSPPGSILRKTLKKRLLDFDRHGSGLILAHFDQGSLVRTLNIPHISPVGAYDADTGRVTVLDVDPEQATPYEVTFNRFYQGLSTDYHHVFSAFGYGSGGYVYIRIE
jgi:hypothetical protein